MTSLEKRPRFTFELLDLHYSPGVAVVYVLFALDLVLTLVCWYLRAARKRRFEKQEQSDRTVIAVDQDQDVATSNKENLIKAKT